MVNYKEVMVWFRRLLVDDLLGGRGLGISLGFGRHGVVWVMCVVKVVVVVRRRFFLLEITSGRIVMSARSFLILDALPASGSPRQSATDMELCKLYGDPRLF
jgi:hypothetical protein